MPNLDQRLTKLESLALEGPTPLNMALWQVARKQDSTLPELPPVGSYDNTVTLEQLLVKVRGKS